MIGICIYNSHHIYSSVGIGCSNIFYLVIPPIVSRLFFRAFFAFVDYFELSDTLSVIILLVIFLSFIYCSYIFRRFY